MRLPKVYEHAATRLKELPTDGTAKERAEVRELSNVHNHRGETNPGIRAAHRWHSDVTAEPFPPTFGILYLAWVYA